MVTHAYARRAMKESDAKLLNKVQRISRIMLALRARVIMEIACQTLKQMDILVFASQAILG